ncbi:hypothetical protein GGI20_001080 [Coemansia sp. BCRC 34301]|nr:hypothetical protein GGI20_001080 [Coemansia sp. BCRC 34301]
MGKSAKAFKRPSKNQKELKKAVKAYPGSTPPTEAPASRSDSALVRTGGGAVTKSKTTKLKAKLAAAKNGSNKKLVKKDYLKIGLCECLAGIMRAQTYLLRTGLSAGSL